MDTKDSDSDTTPITPCSHTTPQTFPCTTTTIPFIEWTSRCEDLLYFFASHKAAGTVRNHRFLDTSFNHCKQLFQKDGDILVIDNHGKQELCDSYPIKLILPKSFVTHIQQSDTHSDTANYEHLCRLIERARYARVHRRFVCPVIFLPNQACIARSSTLSTTGELLLNKATTVVSEALNYCPNSMESPMGHDLNALRAADIKLLQYFNIKFIADLMVEDKKKVGWGRYALTVTSSEKVDREQRYRDFNVSSIPYPGCEFFKRYKDNNHNANGLVFEWDRDIHDAGLNLHWWNETQSDKCEMSKGIEWSEYESWDIITLTQNYLRLIMDYIQSSMKSETETNGMGLLIHCISGWDRTPLFVSLVRLSLWADGMIHCNLDSSEILYLTLSYDWLLFTHQFGNRLIKGEDIFHFTFYIIQYLCSDTYSIYPTNNTHNTKVKEKPKPKTLSKITKKMSEVTKHKLNNIKSRSSTNILSKYMNSNHFDCPFSPPIQITNPNPISMGPKSKSVNVNPNTFMHSKAQNINPSNTALNLSHSWESKGRGPLSSAIRTSYIPTQLTPPSFLPVSLSVNGRLPSPNPLQLVRTQPTITVNTTMNTTPINARNLRNFSWQFVDQKNDSPMFQFIATPKSDPPTHQNHHTALPELNLEIGKDDTPRNIDTNSNFRYPRSAPPSTKCTQNLSLLNFADLVINHATPSPEIIAHPETNIIDMHMSHDDTAQLMMECMTKFEENELERTRSQSLSHRDMKCENQSLNIAKAVVNDVIHNAVSLNPDTSVRCEYKLSAMQCAKSTPVTISDFLGLDGIGVRDSICNSKNRNQNESLSENNVRDLTDLAPTLKKVESFEINVEQVLQPMNECTDSGNNKGRLTGLSRSDRLMQVYALFNKVYTQVMVINEPPSFYKQSVQSHSNGSECTDGDNIDFISSEKYHSYFANQNSDSYQNITTYLKSILPAGLLGKRNEIIDEYNDEYD